MQHRPEFEIKVRLAGIAHDMKHAVLVAKAERHTFPRASGGFLNAFLQPLLGPPVIFPKLPFAIGFDVFEPDGDFDPGLARPILNALVGVEEAGRGDPDMTSSLSSAKSADQGPQAVERQ